MTLSRKIAALLLILLSLSSTSKACVDNCNCECNCDGNCGDCNGCCNDCDCCELGNCNECGVECAVECLVEIPCKTVKCVAKGVFDLMKSGVVKLSETCLGDCLKTKAARVEAEQARMREKEEWETKAYEEYKRTQYSNDQKCLAPRHFRDTELTEEELNALMEMDSALVYVCEENGMYHSRRVKFEYTCDHLVFQKRSNRNGITRLVFDEELLDTEVMINGKTEIVSSGRDTNSHLYVRQYDFKNNEKLEVNRDGEWVPATFGSELPTGGFIVHYDDAEDEIAIKHKKEIRVAGYTLANRSRAYHGREKKVFPFGYHDAQKKEKTERFFKDNIDLFKAKKCIRFTYNVGGIMKKVEPSQIRIPLPKEARREVEGVVQEVTSVMHYSIGTDKYHMQARYKIMYEEDGACFAILHEYLKPLITLDAGEEMKMQEVELRKSAQKYKKSNASNVKRKPSDASSVKSKQSF